MKYIRILCFVLSLFGCSLNGYAGFFLSDSQYNSIEIRQRIQIYSPAIKAANQQYDPETFEPDPRLKANAEEVINLYNRLALWQVHTKAVPTAVDLASKFSEMTRLDVAFDWLGEQASGAKEAVLGYFNISEEEYENVVSSGTEALQSGVEALLGPKGMEWMHEAVQTAGTEFGVDKLAAQTYLNHVALYERQHPDKSFFRLRSLLAKQSCWPCNIAALLLDAMNNLVAQTSRSFTSWALDLLGFMLMVWLAVRVVKFIGGMGLSNPSEFFTDIIKRLLACFFVALFLQIPLSRFYQLTFGPLLSATIETVQLISESTLAPELSEDTVIGKLEVDVPCLERYCQDTNASPTDQSDDIDLDHTDTFGADIRNGLLCVTCQIYAQTAPFIAAGQVLARYGISGEEYHLGISFPKNLSMWLWGSLLAVVFSIFSFFVAFEMIDIFMRLTFVFVLLPFFMVAWAFPISRTYAEKAWSFLVHALLNFLGLCIGMGFVLILFTQLVGNGVDSVAKAMMSTGVVDVSACYAPCRMGKSSCEPECQYMTELFYALFGGEGQGALFTFALMIVVALMGMSVLKSSRTIIEDLSGVSGPGTASFMLSAVADLGKRALSLAGAAIGASLGTKRMMRNTLSSAGKGLGKTRQKSAAAARKRQFEPGRQQQEDKQAPNKQEGAKGSSVAGDKSKAKPADTNSGKKTANPTAGKKVPTSNNTGKTSTGTAAEVNTTAGAPEKEGSAADQIDQTSNHQKGES